MALLGFTVSGESLNGTLGTVLNRDATVSANISYKNYSARGIVVCERWRNSFIAFIEDMGQMPPSPPRYTIDRIDNEGHYSCGKCDECKANSWPMNCRWATYKEQMNNRRKQRFWRGRPVKVT
jgi:hypothetical protein